MGIKSKIGILASLLIISGGMVACSNKSGQEGGSASTTQKKYYCPMHPQIVKDQPGDCPICNMRLVPMENALEPSQSSSGQGKILYYRNPMNPKVTSPVPMKDEMGMDYVPVFEGDQEQSNVSGQARVRVTANQQQLIGVRLGTVERRPLGATIRASARVAYDPDLYNAILEHQQAVANLPKSADGSSPLQKEGEMTVRATQLRLRQMGLSDDQIQRLSRPDFDASNLLVPSAGGTAWVYADIYAYEAPLVKRGQSVELTSTALPGRTFSGTVRSIDTVLNPETRTLRARIEVSKAGGELKPEMYLTASIQTSQGRVLAVPKSAILPTGTRQLAFVEVEAGQYEPRDVRLGRETDDYFEVISGLKEGEKVVTSANFLIDSESKLKSAIQGAGQAHDQKPASQDKMQESQSMEKEHVH